MGNPLNFADEINYSGNAVTLVLTAFGFAPFAGTHNQEEVARVLDGMPGDHALVRAVCSTAVRGQAQRWLVHSAHGWLGVAAGIKLAGVQMGNRGSEVFPEGHQVGMYGEYQAV